MIKLTEVFTYFKVAPPRDHCFSVIKEMFRNGHQHLHILSGFRVECRIK